MTTIKATCPTCGEVELTNDEVRLVVSNVATRSYYAFDCPGCVTEVRKPADEHVVGLLMSGGVTVQVLEIPAEALERHDGAPLDYDDLLDLLNALAATDAPAAAASPVAS